MMEQKDKINYGLIATLAVMLAGSLFLTPDELDKSYFCPLTEDIGTFERLSASSKTGYYIDPDAECANDKGECAVACRTGRTFAPWINLRIYADSIGVDPLSLLKPEEPVDLVVNAPAAGAYTCVSVRDGGCTAI